jgi:hypothetical protein
VGPNCHGFLLDLRVGVLTDAENKDTQGTREFIQVHASVRIKIQRPMCVGCIIIRWVETPSTPPFIGEGGGGRVYKEGPSRL